VVTVDVGEIQVPVRDLVDHLRGAAAKDATTILERRRPVHGLLEDLVERLESIP